MSLPLTSTPFFIKGLLYAICFFIFSAAFFPISTLNSFLICSIIALSSFSPATLTELLEITLPPLIEATSVEPEPIFTTKNALLE